MKIECPSCAAKYSIGDDKVQDRLAKIRCRKCGTTIVIDGKHNPPNIYAADASSAAGDLTATPSAAPAPSPAATSSSEFTIDFGDGDQKNLTLAQVVNAYNKGEITAEHYVWAEGFDDWRALGEVEQIVEALHASARNPALATPAAAAPRAAAIGGRGADLFGGIDQAGSEEDVTTSAASPDIMPHAPAATGARNESSVLFSLSALTSAAASAKPSGGGFDGLATSSSTSSKEDSGLIDLKALTAAAAASERRDAPAPMPIGLGLTPAPLGGVSAPLGLAPPLGGHATSAAMAFDPGPMPQQKNRTGLYIAAGIVIAAVAVALIVVTSKEEPAPIPSATPIAAPAPTPTPTPAPTPEPTADSTAQPPATGAAEEDAGAEKKAPVASRSTWRPKKSTTAPSTTTQTSSKSSGSTAEKPKKKPATSSCGCAPGDLQCAMRCAAGG